MNRLGVPCCKGRPLLWESASFSDPFFVVWESSISLKIQVAKYVKCFLHFHMVSMIHILLTHGLISVHKLLYRNFLCALRGGNKFVLINSQIFQLKCSQSFSSLGLSLKLEKFTIFKCFELKRMCFDLN